MRYLLAPCAMLALWVLAMASAQAGTMLVGHNVVGVGQSPAQELAAYGGTVYQQYSSEPTQDGEPNRVRLLRYPWRSVTPAQVAAMQTRGLWWAIGNENNSVWQDGGLTTDAAAAQYVVWYHDQVAAIKTADPTAKIIGPSVIGWTAYCCAPDIVTGQQAYQRFLTVYQSRYGTLPPMDTLAFHYYPATTYDLAPSEIEMAQQLGMAADYAAAHGWGVAMTEWSFWDQYFDATCTPVGQSEASRYSFVRHGLETMAGRGVQIALFFGNVHQACDQNGHAAYLFGSDGSLTVEGRAHRDFVYGTPTLLAPPSPTRTATFTPSATATMTFTPTLTHTVTATPSVTRYPCIPSYVRRCS